MATLTHSAFRRLVADFGDVTYYYTEMISAEALLNKTPFERYYLDNSPDPAKLIYQVVGRSEEAIKKAVAILCQNECAGVDINMGCSAPAIYKKGEGAAWIQRSEVKKLVSNVKEVLVREEGRRGRHIRLSVKTRLGEEGDKNSSLLQENFIAFIKTLLNCGVENIALHPRYVKEKYKDRLHEEYYNTVLTCIKEAEKEGEIKEGSVTLTANGGIKDKTDIERLQTNYPNLDNFMIGRAAATCPWIFTKLKGNLQERKVDLLEVALKFIDYVEKMLPPEFYKTRLQRFFTYYTENVSFNHYLKTRLLNAGDINKMREELTAYFTKQESERYIKI